MPDPTEIAESQRICPGCGAELRTRQHLHAADGSVRSSTDIFKCGSWNDGHIFYRQESCKLSEKDQQVLALAAEVERLRSVLRLSFLSLEHSPKCALLLSLSNCDCGIKELKDQIAAALWGEMREAGG